MPAPHISFTTAPLACMQIMDYSMLLGVHYRNRGDLVVHALGPSRTTTTSETADRQPGAADATVTLSGGSHDASKPPTLAQMRSLNKQLLRPQNFAGGSVCGRVWVGLGGVLCGDNQGCERPAL